MKIKFLLTVVSVSLFCLNFSATAQDYIDFAQYFSQREISGTARMQGIGGASTSLGGDITSTIGNPAGLGFFNRSEFSISPSLNFHSAKGQFSGASSEDYKTNFNFGSLGVVLNNTKDDLQSGKWRGGSFGISYTRINDFHMKGSINDFEANSSFINYSVDYLNAGRELGLPDLAYETTMIDIFYDEGEDEEYYDQDVIPFGGQRNEDIANRQSESIHTTGASYETTFAYGGNFDDKVYFGASLGLTSLNYRIERRYQETIVASDAYLNNFTIFDDREIQGTGINLTLGAIYRPIQQVTVGLAYSSPTFYNIEENSNSSLVANFSGENPYESSIPFTYEFELKTPSKLNAGATYFIGKSGFITADIEYINYSNNRYTTSDAQLDDADEFISANFEDVVNYKIGGEYRFNIFRARAGYAFFADPTNAFDGIDRSRQSISLGAGIRLPKYYFDLAVVNTQYESNFLPLYEEGFSTAFDNNSTRAMLTFGFNF